MAQNGSVGSLHLWPGPGLGTTSWSILLTTDTEAYRGPNGIAVIPPGLLAS